MKITADVMVVPMGGDQTNASELVAGNIAKFESAGLSTHTHALGVNVQGEDRDVFRALAEALEAMHSAGVPRVYTTVTIESRSDAPPSISDKVAAVSQAG